MSAGGSMLGMEGGSGKHSYATNSLSQLYLFDTYAKPHLSHALDLLLLLILPPPTPSAHSPPSPASQGRHDMTIAPTHTASQHSAPLPPHHNDILHLNVADFGCAYGPNTLHHAAFVLQGLCRRLQHRMASHSLTGDGGVADVELQYFFSDLPSNNFNALLQSLDFFLHTQQVQCFDAAAPFNGRLFSAAVAGSFHGRLFPSGSLHLALSTYALHWLSQVPPEVVDRASPAWNGGHIWIHGARPHVVEAYARQFYKDMKSFLLHRAKEMANGGIAFLFFPGRDQRYPQGAFFTPQHDLWSGCYESTWEEMVLEGLISKEEMDMFNIPFYNCHVTEMQGVLEELSNEFKVERMEVLKDCSALPHEYAEKIMGDSQTYGEYVETFVASLMKPMVEKYLGEARANELFRRLQKQAAKKSCLPTSMSRDVILAIIQRI